MSIWPCNLLGAGRRAALAFIAVLGTVGSASAQVTVSIVDDNGQPITHGFRWLLEEDNTYGIKKTSPDGPWAGQAVTGAPQLPGTPSPTTNWVPGGANPTHTLSVNVHKSHAPTVCGGDTQPANQADCRGDPASCPKPVPGPATVRLDATSCPGFSPAKNYIFSVLPWHTDTGDGWMMSGRNIAAGQQSAKVVVHRYAQPTAQVTVLVFEDNQPINAANDQPAEVGLGEFTLIVSDPAGQVLQDAFAFPLGTTFKYACTLTDGRPCKIVNGQQVALLPEEQPEFQYDADGLPVVDFLGDGSIRTCPGPRGASGTQGYTAYQLANCVDPYSRTPLDRGEAVVRYLTMNKYAIEPVPPPRGIDCGATRAQNGSVDCSDMLLTGTLEGTRQNDSWLRAAEPRYNVTLGSLNWLVFYGFVHPMNGLSRLPGSHTGRLTGRIVYVHDEHPPRSPGVNAGLPVPDCFVGLNNLSGNDEQVYTAPCNSDSTFDIRGIPPGTYQLAIWDKPINAIIDFRTVTIAAGQRVDLQDVPVFNWFARLAGHVFYDANGDGFPSAGVPLDLDFDQGVPNVPINLHFSDGSIIQSTVTDSTGSFSFDQYFAWWRFTVLEVGTGLGKPTGLTAIVDNGGLLPSNRYGDIGIRPQRQPSGQLFRVEAGPVVGSRRIAGPVTEAVNVFQDMTAYVAFGVANYNFSRNENGGIRGFVDYATTRTEEDPKTSASDGWEPGVPNVTVRLHKAKQDCLANPYGDCWVFDDASDPRFPQVTTSDSWNDNIPTDCVSDPYGGGNLWPIPETANGFTLHPCAESFKNWDQTRAGVFDGAFSFDVMRDASGNPLRDATGNAVYLPPGNYIVEIVPPTGYQTLFWGDRNIEFGDPKIPFLVKPPECVGRLTPVPQFHTLYPDQQVPTDTSQAGVPWSASLSLPACDQKLVTLNPGATAALSFNIFTMVPKAARIWGTVWNDLMLEFNPDSPNASGNFAVGYLPVAIKDFKGTEVARFYTDQWGHFDGLVPTNYDIVPPIPLGLVLAMLTVVPNDPGPILDTRPGSPTFNQWVTDPWYNPAFSRDIVRENWEFYPGRTTFIDTVVFPVGAFSGNRTPLNCSYTDRVPELRSTDKVIVSAGDVVTLTAMGLVNVPNPNFDPTATSGPNAQTQVTWDHSFGPPLANSKLFIDGIEVTNRTWAADGLTIRFAVPSVGGRPLVGQVVVQRGDTGARSTVGITLHATGSPVIAVSPPPAGCTGLACGVIQPAIDRALPGTIILIAPGTYQEFLNVWKPITLQGYGAGVTVFDGVAASANLQLGERNANQIATLEASGVIAAVPGQASNYTLEPSLILLAGCGNTAVCGAGGSNTSFFAPNAVTQIDGLRVYGTSESQNIVAGGGIVVNGFVKGLKITNNDIVSNEGSIGGGVRVGEPLVATNFNPGLVVDHNRIAQNGSRFSGGGGLAFYAGTDGYRVTNNFICGNFSQVYGGGIGHFGLSLGSNLIQDNAIVSNESFDEGGGIHIGGDDTAAGATALSPGAGSVLIDRNLIQGNKSGDDGGGIRTRRGNGQDVAANRADPSRWYHIDIANNLIVNNSSADHGGGLSFDDTVAPTVINNTVARNDCTSTGSDAFGGPCVENDPLGQRCPAAEAIGGLTTSVPQVGGIASFAHSTALFGALTGAGSFCATHATDRRCSRYPNPLLTSNVVWQNRSFYWDATANNALGGLVLASAATASGPPLPGGYWDFAVYGVPGATLAPTYSSLTNGIGAAPSSTNQVNRNPFPGTPVCTGALPLPGCTYFNVYQATSKGAALGNFVTVLFTPNGVQGNYHVPDTSPVVASGGPIVDPLQTLDIDRQSRVAPVDIGADQTSVARTGAAGLVARLINFFRAPASWWPSALPPEGESGRSDGPVYKPRVDRAFLEARTAPDTARPGLGPPLLLRVSATVLDFGAVQRGLSSPPQFLELTNPTDATLEVTRSLTGDEHFITTVDDVPWTRGARTLPPRGSLSVKVAYAPGGGTALGARTLLTFQAAGSGAPLHRVLLAGSAE